MRLCVCPAALHAAWVFPARYAVVMALQGRCVLCAGCIGSKLCCGLVGPTWRMSQLLWLKPFIYPLLYMLLHWNLTSGEASLRSCYLACTLGWEQRDCTIMVKHQVHARPGAHAVRSRLSACGTSATRCGVCGMCCVRLYTVMCCVDDAHWVCVALAWQLRHRQMAAAAVQLRLLPDMCCQLSVRQPCCAAQLPQGKQGAL